MLLTKEITNIKEIAKEYGDKYTFCTIDKNIDSYYTNYSRATHQGDALNEYSSEVISFRKNLSELWLNKDNSYFFNDLLSSIMKTKDDEESVLEAIQLFNYMM